MQRDREEPAATDGPRQSPAGGSQTAGDGSPGAATATVRVPVYGMTCQGCATTVGRGLSRLGGVSEVRVDADGDLAEVSGPAGGLDEAAVRARVEEMGYDLEPPTEEVSWSHGQLAAALGLAAVVVAAGWWVFTAVSGSLDAGARATFEQASLAGFALAFGLGLAAAFAPSSLAMAPAVMGAVLEGHAHSRRRAVALSAAFVAGVLVVDAAVGAVFAAGGQAAIDWLEARLAIWFALMVVVLAVLGVYVLDIWRPRLPGYVPDVGGGDGIGGAFAAGVPFGLLACPSCTPMLLPVILGAAATGDPVYGAGMLAVFGLGRGLPLVVFGTSAGAARTARSLRRYVPVVEKTVGALLLAGAAYFLWLFAVTVATRGIV